MGLISILVNSMRSLLYRICGMRNLFLIDTSSQILQAPSFYWELEICHLGESSTDAAHIAMGYSPEPQKPPEGQPWAYPTEAVLIRRYFSFY